MAICRREIARDFLDLIETRRENYRDGVIQFVVSLNLVADMKFNRWQSRLREAGFTQPSDLTYFTHRRVPNPA